MTTKGKEEGGLQKLEAADHLDHLDQLYLAQLT